MQKIIIKKFGAVKDAEIEINKVLVLIGEQASGKSTIAKLIYFFKSLRDELFNHIYQDNSKDYFDITSDLIFPIREKFYDFFGSTFHLPDFEVTYYYSVENDKYLKLTLNQSKKLHPKFSAKFLSSDFKSKASEIKRILQKATQSDNIHEQIVNEQNRYKNIQSLSSFVNEAFCSFQTTALYVIAGRNATVSYSDLFGKYLFASIQSKIEDNKLQSYKKKEQTVDETLMLSFIERVSKIKNLLEKYGNFEGLIEYYINDNTEKEEFRTIIKKIDEILKGKYAIDRWGEKIIIDEGTGQYVHLHNSSSGQQEVVRILQDLFLILIEKQKALRIIEEPEAHLFPVAQKLVVELLALFINHDNEIIITTHSPYVLTVFNNLLFANRVVEKNKNTDDEVSDIIEKSIRIKQTDFSAYSLTGTTTDESSPVFCENIVSNKTGLIDQNYLDTASEMLSSDFDRLYSIHSKTMLRK
ncbi:MAG: ATP-binding protein [Bacteroidales bacterium]|nr:ATP-binding protein [Bacteroidales bacterium]MCF8458940.1 ATP-binding protein [Bacteroidales bacterium]